MPDDDPLLDPDRLAAVEQLGLAGEGQQPLLARLNRLAQQLLGVPVSILSIITADRQVHASQLGLFDDTVGPSELPMTHSFCKNVARTGQALVVTDAREDPVVMDSPSIQDHAVIAYAGFPLRLETGEVVGAFCAIDHVPREWTPAELEIVKDLTELAVALLDQRRAVGAGTPR